MVWTFVFPVVLCMLCSLLAFQQMRIDRRLRRMAIDASSFEGPARLELFGHVTHIGWVRQGPERIDLLTIEGEALQCDARARYRLTPLAWKEFVDECLRRKEEGITRARHEIRALREARAESEARRGALRIAISDALEAFNEWANAPEVAVSMANKGIQILDAAREKDEEHDDLPF